MKKMLATLVPLLLLATPTVAAAETLSRPVVVSVAGIDLGTTEGAATLLKRVHNAAERGCGYDPTWDRLSDDYRRCRAKVVNAAVERIDAPLVTALYRGEALPTLVAAAK